MDSLFRIDVLLFVGMAAAGAAVLAGLRGVCGVTISSRIDRENQNTFPLAPHDPAPHGPAPGESQPSRSGQRRRAA